MNDFFLYQSEYAPLLQSSSAAERESRKRRMYHTTMARPAPAFRPALPLRMAVHLGQNDRHTGCSVFHYYLRLVVPSCTISPPPPSGELHCLALTLQEEYASANLVSVGGAPPSESWECRPTTATSRSSSNSKSDGKTDPLFALYAEIVAAQLRFRQQQER